MLGLRWNDVNLDDGRLHISQSLTAIHNQLEYSEPKTARGRRNVAVDSETIAVLRSYRKTQLEEQLAWGAGYNAAGLVFTREDGRPIHPDRFTSWFKQHALAAGLPGIRLHDLRHTHASLALQAGVHPKVVSERLGHSTISITLDTYSHVLPSLQEEAAQKVASLLFDPEVRPATP